MKKLLCVLAAVCIFTVAACAFSGCAGKEDFITLRVCSWEEYIDLGGWDEAIELEDGEKIIKGESSMVDDFTAWFNENYGYKVKVEYSTFGTNEDLYNRLKLGDKYDLVCPSDYMMMKLLAEDRLLEYSDAFRNGENNFYAENVSPYIDGVFEENGWNAFAACYMWGTLGLVYNPEKLKKEEDVSRWDMLLNESYKRQVTVKDNVRDAYFATLGILNREKIISGEIADLSAAMNDVDVKTVAAAEDILKKIKNNVYSFETDSGKADMVTGKVIANEQWSGDAVYIMDEAEEDGATLWYSVPDECTNLWFDGWVMLKDGINGNARRRQAAEAFVNFLSRPDNAVRNMYYIGYTSAICGGEVADYLEWNYAAEDAEEIYDYDLTYFFFGLDEKGKKFVLPADAADFETDADGNVNRGRQLFAQYPPENVIARSVVMLDFGDRLADINAMWINVRCPDLKDISPVTVGVGAAVAAVCVGGILLYVFRYRIFGKYKPKKGYAKVET